MTRPFDVTETINMLSGSLNFTETYTRDTFPSLITTKGLTLRTFHKADKDKYCNKLPWNCSNAETQLLVAKACLSAAEGNNDYRYLNFISLSLDAFLNYFFVEKSPNTVLPNTDINYKPYRFHRLVVVRDSIQLKGSQTEQDPFNFGNFDTVVTFTSGTGVLPSGSNGLLTSDVFKVYPTTSNLLYKNVDSPLVGSDAQYAISYYVCNYNLEGQNYRIYSNGTFTTTSETAGTIKLTTGYTGDTKVLWANYSNTQLAAPTDVNSGQGLVETYPIAFNCARNSGYHLNSTFSVFYSAYETLNKAATFLTFPKFQSVANALKYSAIAALKIDNKSYIYKKESYTNALKQPGIILTANNTRNLTGLLTVSRDTATGHVNQLKAVATSSVTSIKLENILNAINFTDTTQLSVEAASSVETVLNITLSQSLDATDTTKDYQAQLLVSATSTTITKAFSRKNFLKFDSTKTIWNSINNSVASSVTGTGMVTTSKVQTLVNDWQPVVTQIVFNKSVATDTAIAILSGATFNNTQPKIVYSATGGSKVKVKNSSGDYFSFSLPSTSGNWVTLQIDISALSNLVELSIESTEIVSNTVRLFFVGSTPSTMPAGTVYKTSIEDKYSGVHTLWLGDIYTTGNSLETLPYYPGITPDSVEVFKTGSTFSNSKIYGNCLISNLDPYALSHFGESTNVNNQLQMLSDALDAYTVTDTSNTNKLLNTLFVPAFWNNPKFSDIQGIKILGSNYYYQNNYFTSSNTDPDFDNFTVVAKAIENVSKYLLANPGNEIAKKVVTSFLSFVEKFYINNGNNQPPTTVLNPTSEFHNPENAALIGKVALYANLSGLDADLTIDIIKRSYTYLVTQYVSTGDTISSMIGSWSKGQNTFVSESTTYKEYTTAYHFQVIDFLGSLLKNGNNLKYPYVYTPDTFPNIVPDYIDNIKLPIYKNAVNKFTDNEQTILLSNTGTGLEMTLKYSLVDANKLQTLTNFWKDQGGKSGSFVLPLAIWKHPNILRTALNLNNLKFAFADTLSFDVRVADSVKGLWRLEIKLIQTIRKVYNKTKKVHNGIIPYPITPTSTRNLGEECQTYLVKYAFESYLTNTPNIDAINYQSIRVFGKIGKISFEADIPNNGYTQFYIESQGYISGGSATPTNVCGIFTKRLFGDNNQGSQDVRVRSIRIISITLSYLNS